MIRILYGPVEMSLEGKSTIDHFPSWPFTPFQQAHHYLHTNSISLTPASLDLYLKIQQKQLYQCSHNRMDYSFYELNNHWAIGLNFCAPFSKRLNQLNKILEKSVNIKEEYIISGFTIRQLLENKPLSELDVIIYIILPQSNTAAKIACKAQFGSDNYYRLENKEFGQLRIYRGYYESIPQAVVYMQLKLFSKGEKVYCTADAIQSGWLFSPNYTIELPIQPQNQPKFPLQLYEKGKHNIIRIFRRIFILKNYSQEKLGYFWRRCYVCHNYIERVKLIKQKKVDFNISQEICDLCSRKQKEYLNLTADLSDKYVLITGARVKIGYALCLRLLRNGAKVFGFTRYPHLALANYKKQPDYQTFKERLILIQCDLINVPYLTTLLKSLKEQIAQIRGKGKPYFDIVINNACHTVAPPKEFYQRAAKAQQLLKKAVTYKGDKEKEKNLEKVEEISQEKKVTEQRQIALLDHRVQYIDCKLQQGSKLDQVVPLDKFGEVAYTVQAKNSWNKSLSELSVEQILNANLINQISPTLIIREIVQELPPGVDLSVTPIIVINVTSNQGYYRAKDDTHIHTNMAKASLDMLTFSLNGSTTASNRRYYYSVDPGFVSSVVTETTPLTPEMGASRIFHPVYCLFNKGKPLDQYRYKNYRPFDN